VPPEGLKVGVATCGGGRIVYVPLAVSLSVMPLLNALALIVVVTLTEIGPEYRVDKDEGSEPSTVYLIVAPEVAQSRSTLWDEKYVPPAGLKVGVATCGGGRIIYVPLAVSLSVMPLLNALALIVTVPLSTRIGLEYTSDVDKGSEPSTVYLIVTPSVLQLSTTFWGEE
jgi:hypothetical protein